MMSALLADLNHMGRTALSGSVAYENSLMACANKAIYIYRFIYMSPRVESNNFNISSNSLRAISIAVFIFSYVICT